jgi:phosphate:Na+ symporter
VQRYHETTGEQALLAAALPAPAGDAAVTAAWRAFKREGDGLLAHCDAVQAALQEGEEGRAREPAAGQAANLGPAVARMEAAYDALKATLLAAGAAGGMRLGQMEEALQRSSALRRAAQQAVKAVSRHPVSGDPSLA